MNARWLSYLIRRVDPGGSRYDTLLEILADISFVSLVPHDDNRIGDVYSLMASVGYRHGASIETNRREYGDVSVLEVLIALSERMAEITVDLDRDEDARHWFWTFIEHLQLDNFVDELSDEDCAEISTIGNRFVNRRYSRDGYGGLFPLNHPVKDQRKVELWHQMHNWINENIEF